MADEEQSDLPGMPPSKKKAGIERTADEIARSRREYEKLQTALDHLIKTQRELKGGNG